MAGKTNKKQTKPGLKKSVAKQTTKSGTIKSLKKTLGLNPAKPSTTNVKASSKNHKSSPAKSHPAKGGHKEAKKTAAPVPHKKGAKPEAPTKPETKGKGQVAVAKGQAAAVAKGQVAKSTVIAMAKGQHGKPSKRAGKAAGEKATHTESGAPVCREVACELMATTGGYCRMHYIKNWKKIKRKEMILKEKKLNHYVEELVSKYPDKYIEAIRQDLASEKDFSKVIADLEIEEGLDDFESVETESAEGIIDNLKRDFEDEGDAF